MKYYSTRYAHNILTGDFDESPQLYSESVKPEGRSPQHKGTHRNARTHALTHSMIESRSCFSFNNPRISVWKLSLTFTSTGSRQNMVPPAPAPPPGAPKQQETRLIYLPDGRMNTYNGQPPNARYNGKGQRILPGGGGGARFIPPDEYKEFLQLGHGGIFDLDLDNIDVSPWRERGADLSSYFNYGLDERSWRTYAKAIRRARLEQHLQNKIEAYAVDSVDTPVIDSDLPLEVRMAIGSVDSASVQDVPIAPSYGHQPKQHEVPCSTFSSQQIAKVLNSDRPGTTHGHPSGVRVNDLSDQTTVSDKYKVITEFDGLQVKVEALQQEYKSAMESGQMTPEKNFQLQQQMLQLKRRMMKFA